LTNETQEVEKAYKNAVIAAGKDWFTLKTANQRLLIFRDLSFRPSQVTAATQVLDSPLCFFCRIFHGNVSKEIPDIPCNIYRLIPWGLCGLFLVIHWMQARQYIQGQID
jgi:hypothetical protein